ncbi:hypothetical protein CES85_4935 [Ochrobactrum quorumnocens]|uniref:Uncharacterized protein n=1 Tax=Ochrobactrum quorumnocens TaxID=271865 RepID=A0A248UBH4_9HYPH|nr:hypothetical protein CES85_4935 [[Ochrobactrum] quorumnocens]
MPGFPFEPPAGVKPALGIAAPGEGISNCLLALGKQCKGEAARFDNMISEPACYID